MAGPGIKNEKERLIEEILITNYEKYYRLAYGYVHNDARRHGYCAGRGIQGNPEIGNLA